MLRTEFPAMKWHPTTGENQIFNAQADVPDGWLDCHPASADKAKPAAELKAGLPMTKDEIIAALKECDVPFKAQNGAKALYDLLDTALRSHFAAESIAIPEGADVPALLAIIKTPAQDG